MKPIEVHSLKVRESQVFKLSNKPEKKTCEDPDNLTMIKTFVHDYRQVKMSIEGGFFKVKCEPDAQQDA